jgi:hypothetical protein
MSASSLWHSRVSKSARVRTKFNSRLAYSNAESFSPFKSRQSLSTAFVIYTISKKKF